ncbi:MAG: hypothetical protein HOW73_47530 [Polyangiaceae bacterium]|nr:hypothetical protein [Polyangiaceae bacterium]
MAEVYDQFAMTIAGDLQSECTALGIQYMSSDEVLSVLGGGTNRTVIVSPGERYMRITWSFCVPSFGDDLDLLRKYADCEEIAYTVFAMGSKKTIRSTGWLMQPNIRGQVGSNTMVELSIVGPEAVF